jgi:hypothetical protein
MQGMMQPVLLRFDMHALQAVLNAERQARGLTWPELALAINRPFEGTTSIPISVSTLSGMTKKRSVTSAVVLQVLAWLGRTPESFLAGRTAAPGDGEQLPDAGPGHVLRFDTRAIYEALNARRRERALTWKQAARELPGFTENMLTNLAGGPLIGFPRVMALTQWLGRPAADFVRVRRY